MESCSSDDVPNSFKECARVLDVGEDYPNLQVEFAYKGLNVWGIAKMALPGKVWHGVFYELSTSSAIIGRIRPKILSIKPLE